MTTKKEIDERRKIDDEKVEFVKNNSDMDNQKLSEETHLSEQVVETILAVKNNERLQKNRGGGKRYARFHDDIQSSDRLLTSKQLADRAEIAKIQFISMLKNLVRLSSGGIIILCFLESKTLKIL